MDHKYLMHNTSKTRGESNECWESGYRIHKKIHSRGETVLEANIEAAKDEKCEDSEGWIFLDAE